MNDSLLNSLFVYLDILYDSNKILIKQCSMEFDNYESSFKNIIYLTQNVQKLIPYDCKKDKLFINVNDGLIEFDDETNNIFNNFSNLLKNNYEILNNIRIIGNKCKHKIQDITRQTSIYGGLEYSISLEVTYNDERIVIELETRDFIKLF